MAATANAQHPPSSAPGALRTLRRPGEDRIVAGVGAGLGRYFAVDPVLFRVLFAVFSLFGGIGLVMYALAWLIIPDQNIASSGLDRVLAEIRRRRIPLAPGIAVAVVVSWLAVFGWWAPDEGTFAVIAASVLIVILSRFHREPVVPPPGTDGVVSGTYPPLAVDLRKTGSVSAGATALMPDGVSDGEAERDDVPAGRRISAAIDRWRSASRERRRRSRPLFLLTIGLAFAAAVTVYIADIVTGVRLDAYFIATGAVVLAGLVVGLALRRPAWTLTLALFPLAAGLAVFAGSPTSLNDGVGRRTWTPTTSGELREVYRSGVGQSTLDLRQLSGPAAAGNTTIELGAGEVRLWIPRTLAVQLDASVRFGDVSVDGRSFADGTSLTQTVLTPAAQSSPAALRLRITVHLRAGTVRIDYF